MDNRSLPEARSHLAGRGLGQGEPYALISRIYHMSQEAREVIEPHIRRTPLEESGSISRAAGKRVYLKLENMQKTGSFKVRGALYKLYKIKDEYRGVVTASAGNHAQGVAYASRVYGLRSVIVMPENASIAKIHATKAYGAEVILHGRVYDEAYQKALEIAQSRGYALIHAFDDPEIIAGQATLAYELLEQAPGAESLVVPVGGGGLASGVSIVYRYLSPETMVVGVEPKAAPKASQSLKAGRPVETPVRPSVADGLIVKQLGTLTFSILRETLDGMLTVSEEAIAHAIYLLLERSKILAEGAGAAPVAALIEHRAGVKGETAIAIVSGGNIDLTNIYRIVIRGLRTAKRIARIAGHIPDSPGQLKAVLEVIARHRGNVIAIHHERTDPRSPAWHAKITIEFEQPEPSTVNSILADLARNGYVFWEE